MSTTTFLQIDLQNLFYAAKSKGNRIDYEKVWDYFHGRESEFLTDSVIYMIRNPDINSEKFESKLKAIGYRLEVKNTYRHLASPLKCNRCNNVIKEAKYYYHQSNHDVSISVDCMSKLPMFDKLILMSGDGDFSYLCKFLKDNGKQVEIWSFKESFNPLLSVHADRVNYIGKDFFFRKPNLSVFGINSDNI